VYIFFCQVADVDLLLFCVLVCLTWSFYHQFYYLATLKPNRLLLLSNQFCFLSLRIFNYNPIVKSFYSLALLLLLLLLWYCYYVLVFYPVGYRYILLFWGTLYFLNLNFLTVVHSHRCWQFINSTNEWKVPVTILVPSWWSLVTILVWCSKFHMFI
jgi:hypothetical protein